MYIYTKDGTITDEDGNTPSERLQYQIVRGEPTDEMRLKMDLSL